MRRGRQPLPVGLIPYTVYVLVFLGVPLWMVLSEALGQEGGGLTFHNISESLSQPQFKIAFRESLILSLWTSAIGAFFGTWLAYAVVVGKKDGLIRRIVSSGSGVLAYFAGVPLAFAFIAAIGRQGALTELLRDMGLDIYAWGFHLDSVTGVGLAYVYFQIPLMVLLVTPALDGLRPQWREAAQNLGASHWDFWRTVGIPVLFAPVVGAFLLLYGNAFAAYATAYALVTSGLPLVPLQITSTISSNVLVGQERIGLALGLDMIVIMAILMIAYGLLARRASRWLT